MAMMHLLSDIAKLAVLRVDSLFTREQFLSGVLRELSVSLCKTNACLSPSLSNIYLNELDRCVASVIKLSNVGARLSIIAKAKDRSTAERLKSRKTPRKLGLQCNQRGVSGFFMKPSGVCLRHGQNRPTTEGSKWDKCFALCLFVDIFVGSIVFVYACLGSFVRCTPSFSLYCAPADF
jgi:hypothetical protein